MWFAASLAQKTSMPKSSFIFEEEARLREDRGEPAEARAPQRAPRRLAMSPSQSEDIASRLDVDGIRAVRRRMSGRAAGF